MLKWNMIIDIAKCEDCNNCFLACKDEHVGNDWPGCTASQPLHGHRWMNIMRRERGEYPMIDVAYRPTPCMHCDSAPCIEKAANGAVYKRDDGIVIIDPEKAVGQKGLLSACPYGAIFWNEEKNIPQKCTFCAHLLDQKWEKPRCAQACPTGALTAVCVEDREMDVLVKAEDLGTLMPEKKTRPRVYYKNLYRYTHCFIGGSVSHQRNGRDECAEGASIVLMKAGEKISEGVSDCFGEFKFDGLEKDSGIYTVQISFMGTIQKLDVVVSTGSCHLGNVVIPVQ